MTAMRFVMPSVAVTFVAFFVAFPFSNLAALFDMQDVNFHHHHGDFSANDDSGIGGGTLLPADMTSLLQGLRMRVDRLSDSDQQDIPETPTLQAQARKKTTDASMVSMSERMSSGTQVLHDISQRAMLWHTYALSVYTQGLSRDTGSIAVVMLVLLIGCTCLAVATLLHPEKFGLETRRTNLSRTNLSPASGETAKDSADSLQPKTRPSIFSERYSRTSAVPTPQMPLSTGGSGRLSSRLAYLSHLPERNFLARMSKCPTPPVSDTLAPSPIATGHSLAPDRGEALKTFVVPPLCPTMVMPLVECRFGIPMYEIAQLTEKGEGELQIVGLSSNPLLRAVVKPVPNGRKLEISMPERHGLSRATLAPHALELTGASAHGSRALEIRGMGGIPYGLLEMCSNGACSVIKDDQTILSIDGQAENLQLVLKAGDGRKVSDMRCSAAPFGGVDHVEIRVDPGIDTVLVLAVVLAVLLLSPYMPSSEAET